MLASRYLTGHVDFPIFDFSGQAISQAVKEIIQIGKRVFHNVQTLGLFVIGLVLIWRVVVFLRERFGQISQLLIILDAALFGGHMDLKTGSNR